LDPQPDLLDPRDPRPAARRRLRAWLALQMALSLRPQEAAPLLRRTRDPADVLAALAAELRPDAARLDAAEAALRDAGVRGLPLLSSAYPPQLGVRDDPPLLLWVRGDPRLLREPAVAIVGARAPTAYGRGVARSFARGVARAGALVISGLARGIDAEAHRGTLEAGGRTLAVQACGPDLVYPREHRRLAEQIAETGAVVTELAPGTPPRSVHFPLRNRVISGLARAVVVVEARERSGSLITADHAARQGVELLAVPGPIHAPTSVGPNRLLCEGARPALCVDDVLDAARLPRVGAAPAVSAPPPEAAAPLLRALGEAPATRDELGRRLGRAPEQLAFELLELELGGWVVEDRDGRLRLLRSASP
jgi:DNA processing protein